MRVATKEEAQEAIDKANRKVTLKATDGHPHIKEGEVFEIHHNHEKKLIDNGWAIASTEKVGTINPGKDTKVGGKAVKPAEADVKG